MTENEAIRHLEDLQRLYLGNEKFTADIEAIGMAIKALEQTKWIPCKERLPEDDGWYLCTIQKETETKVAEIRFFEDTKWKAYGWNVIAWMNEPQPYKAESEG